MQINLPNKTVNNVWSMLLVLIVCVALYSLVFTLKVLGDDSAFSMWALGAVLVLCNFKEILNSIQYMKDNFSNVLGAAPPQLKQFHQILYNPVVHQTQFQYTDFLLKPFLFLLVS